MPREKQQELQLSEEHLLSAGSNRCFKGEHSASLATGFKVEAKNLRLGVFRSLSRALSDSIKGSRRDVPDHREFSVQLW